MPIDASIISGLKPVQMESPMNGLAKLLEVQGAQQNMQMGRMKMDEYQQGLTRASGLRSLLSQSYDNPAAREDALLKGGYVEDSLKLGKDRRENAKVDAEADYKKLEATHKRMDMIGQGLGYLKDNPTPENVKATLQGFVQSGLMPMEIAQQKLAELQADPTPEGIRNRATMGFQAALQAKDQLPKYETRNLGGTTETMAINPITGKTSLVNSMANSQSPDSVASVGNAANTAQMVDARARELKATKEEENRLKREANKGEFAKLTEDQGKATGWLVQAENAYKNMMAVGVDEKGAPTDAAKPGFTDALAGIPSFGLTGGIANMMRGADRQKFIQATSSLSESLLRAATGAGVNRDEAEQKVKELTPQFGEDAETTKQKYAAIPLYIESLKVRAGPGASRASAITGNSEPTQKGVTGSFDQPAGMVAVTDAASYARVPSGATYTTPDGKMRKKP